MKKIFKYILVAGLSLGLMSCDKFFDSMEGDLSKVSAEDLLASNSGLLGLLANLYSNLPDMGVSTADQGTLYANGSRSTPSYANGTGGTWSYGTIRSIHKFMEAVESAQKAGTLDENTAKGYLGEAHFLRACMYFAGVRAYGGMPLLDRALDDVPIDSEDLYKLGILLAQFRGDFRERLRRGHAHGNRDGRILPAGARDFPGEGGEIDSLHPRQVQERLVDGILLHGRSEAAEHLLHPA